MAKEEKGSTTTSTEDGLIQTVDYGDYTVEIDNRGPTQQRRTLPKSTRSIGVSAKVRHELEERVETEVVEPEKVWESYTEPEQRKENLPPEEDPDAEEKREKEAAEAEEKARQRQDEQTESYQQEARATRAAVRETPARETKEKK